MPITQAIEEVLVRAKAHMRARARLSPYVVHKLEGSAYTAHGVGTAWERARQRAGIEDATLKDLRAKHATDAEKAGYAVDDIRKSLAHEDSSTTRVYLKQRAEVLSPVELSFPGKPKKGVC